MIGAVNRIMERAYMALNPVFRSERARQSKQLEEFRNLNFGSMPTELGRLFSADTAQMTKGLRYFNITGKACDDVAIQLSVPPARRFTEVSDAQAKRWAEIYAELGVDDVLAIGERQAVAQQCMVYGHWPDTRGRLRLIRFLTYQVDEVSFDDPWAAAGGELQDASRVVLCRPAYYSSDTYQAGPTTQFIAKVVMTRDEAYVEMPNGDRSGLFRPDMRNPLGFIPLQGTRRALPIDDTDWSPEVSQDMLSVSIGTILAATDWEHIVRQDLPRKTYLTGQGARLMTKDSVKVLAGGLIPLPLETTVTVTDTAPAIDKYIMAMDRTLALFAQMRNLSPEGYTGLTGNAKNVDMFALEQERLKQENRLRTLERGLVRLIARVHVLTQRSALTLEEPTLDVSYVYPRPRENVLQEAQAIPLLASMGLLDLVDEIARNEKVGPEEAARRFEDRMQRQRDLFQGMKVPGVDKIQSQVQTDKNAPKVAVGEPPAEAAAD